jgi:hypothetical protein
MRSLDDPKQMKHYIFDLSLGCKPQIEILKGVILDGAYCTLSSCSLD